MKRSYPAAAATLTLSPSAWSFTQRTPFAWLFLARLRSGSTLPRSSSCLSCTAPGAAPRSGRRRGRTDSRPRKAAAAGGPPGAKQSSSDRPVTPSAAHFSKSPAMPRPHDYCGRLPFRPAHPGYFQRVTALPPGGGSFSGCRRSLTRAQPGPGRDVPRGHAEGRERGLTSSLKAGVPAAHL